MAVTLNAVATANTSNAVSPSTLDNANLTIAAGTDRVLLALVSYNHTAAMASATVNWDSAGTPQAMTKIIEINNGNERVTLWGLVAPTTGNKTLSWASNGGSVSEVFLDAICFDGANQTGGATTFPNSTSATGTSTAPSVAITSAAGNMTVEAGVGPEVVSAPSKTQIYADNSGSVTSGWGSYAAGAASNTHSWTLAGSVAWAQVGTDVAAATVTAALTGTATASITEADIVAGGKTIIATLIGDTYVAASVGPVTPVIETADGTQSGSNTAADPWPVNHPDAATGDLLIFILGWDDSTTTSSVAAPAGPNSEVISSIAGPVASASTEVRMQAWYTVATGAWTAGTVSFNPSASESRTASVLRVPAGEFDPTTPIGASATRASAGTAETSVLMPAFTAGSTDGDGRLVWAGTADADPQTTLAGGYTSITSVDRGAVSLSVQTRDAAVSNSESLSGGTRAIASDSWCSIGFIVRAPAATTPFADARQAFINGFDSAQAEGTGWDAEVKAKAAVTEVVRTSDTVATWTIAAQSGYNITAQETITGTIPASILTGASPIVATPTFTIDTAGATTHATSGVLAGPGAAITGTASSATPRPSSGALIGPGAAVVGTATRTRVHATDGTLAGPGAVIAGTAARFRAFATAGVLIGQGAVIAGTADSATARPSSGVLVGQGAVVVGTAARTGSAVEHATNGTLVGPGSVVAGTAARFRAFATSGVLAGPGAVIVGAAAHIAIHGTTGVLTGQGTLVVGVAARSGVSVPTGHRVFPAIVNPGTMMNRR